MESGHLLDFLEDAVAIADTAGKILVRNQAWTALFPEAGDASDTLQACLGGLRLERAETPDRPEVLRRDASWFEHRVKRCPPPFASLDAGQPYWLHQLREITASWRLAEERHFLERLYQTLSRCNQALVRAQDAKRLAQDVCDALTQIGGYRYTNISVWVAMTDGSHFDQLAWAAHPAIIDKADLLERLHQASQTFIDSHLLRLGERPLESRRQPASIPAEAFDGDFPSPLAIECYPLIDGDKPLGALVVASTPGDLDRIQEFGLLEELAGDLAFGLDTLRLREKAAQLEAERQAQLSRERDRLWAAVQAIANTIELRDPYTAGHQQRVREIALRLAEILALDEKRRDGLALAASIHDIGKIQVPAEILARPGKLSEAEYLLIQQHPAAGAAILAPIDFPWPVAEIVHQHHERIDGSGYPRGLRGDEILIEAQILAVADVIEAMATHRPYRPALPLLDALQFVVRNRERLFSGRIVDACVKLFIEQRYDFLGASGQASAAAAR
jgi:GAF domain-containing protein